LREVAIRAWEPVVETPITPEGDGVDTDLWLFTAGTVAFTSAVLIVRTGGVKMVPGGASRRPTQPRPKGTPEDRTLCILLDAIFQPSKPKFTENRDRLFAYACSI
jgi:hypothetical protein